MKRSMKKIIAILLMLVLTVATGLTAFATEKSKCVDSEVVDEVIFNTKYILENKIVKIDCINERANHKDINFWGVLGGCTVSPVKGNCIDGYTVDVTVTPDVYVGLYSARIGVKHVLSPADQRAKTVTFALNKKTGIWKVVSELPVVYTVTCGCGSIPSIPNCPELPDCPKWPNCPELPDCPEWPNCPELPDCPEWPNCPELPDCPEWPNCPELPDCPEWPNCPELPDCPEWPNCPELPDCPEVPDCPETEETPEEETTVEETTPEEETTVEETTPEETTPEEETTVEETTPEETTVEETSEETTPEETTTVEEGPSTGDSSPVLFLSILMVFSLAGLCTVFFAKRARK